MEQQQLSPIEIDGRINMLSQQRNEALDRCAIVAGLLAVANKRIQELEAAAEGKKDAAPPA